MAFQIKKQRKLIEDIELLADDDSVAMTLHVEINIDAIAREYRLTQAKLAAAQKKAAEQSTEALEEYGNAVIAMFTLVLGEENTEKALEYFENKYSEMAIQLMPFVTNVVQPAIQRSVEEKRALLANNYHLSRRQKRKLGL